MEISNRSLVVASACVILFGISLRVQSGSVSNSEQTAASSGSMQSKPIPDSDFNEISKYQTIPQQPIESNLGGTPNQNLIRLNQAGAIVPGVTKVQDDSKPTAVTASGGSTNGSAQQDAYPNMQGYGGYGNGVPNATTGNSMLDTAAGSLNDDDQAGLAMMWAGMTVAQKEQFIARLQQNR